MCLRGGLCFLEGFSVGGWVCVWRGGLLWFLGAPFRVGVVKVLLCFFCLFVFCFFCGFF